MAVDVADILNQIQKISRQQAAQDKAAELAKERREARKAKNADKLHRFDVLLPEDVKDTIAGLAERYIRVMIAHDVAQPLWRCRQRGWVEGKKAERKLNALWSSYTTEKREPEERLHFPALSAEERIARAEVWAHETAENCYSCGLCSVGGVISQYDGYSHPQGHMHSWEDNVRLYEDLLD